MATRRMDTSKRGERTAIRRDVVPRFILHLVGHVRVVRIPELLVVRHLLLESFQTSGVAR